MALPAKVSERVKTALKKFQPILQSAKTRDVNESDTVVIVTDILEHIFGYDKYSEITSEHAIRGTYCDLAIKLDGKLSFLIEVKAIGLELKEQHVKQAVDYAANQGLEWVGLTNGVEWRVYQISFGKPINSDLVVSFNLLDMTSKKDDDVEVLGLLVKEGWQKAYLEQYSTVKQVFNKFTIGAVLMSEPVVDLIRRELRRISSEIKVTEDEVRAVLKEEVIKREIFEGDKAQVAQKHVSKSQKKTLRKTKGEAAPEEGPAEEDSPEGLDGPEAAAASAG